MFRQSDTKPNIELRAINETQEYITRVVLDSYLDDILACEPDVAINALNMILAPVAPTGEEMLTFKQCDIASNIYTVRAIMDHPCPQNRTTSYPYFGAPSDPNMVVYKNDQGDPEFEPRGLLGLTARNDNTALTVTKEAVVAYIRKYINEAIRLQTAKLESRSQPVTLVAPTTLKPEIISDQDKLALMKNAILKRDYEAFKKLTVGLNQSDLNELSQALVPFLVYENMFIFKRPAKDEHQRHGSRQFDRLVRILALLTLTPGFSQLPQDDQFVLGRFVTSLYGDYQRKMNLPMSFIEQNDCSKQSVAREQEIMDGSPWKFAKDIYNEVTQQFEVNRLQQVDKEGYQSKLYSEEDFVCIPEDDGSGRVPVIVKLGDLLISFEPGGKRSAAATVEIINRQTQSVQLYFDFYQPRYIKQCLDFESLFPFKLNSFDGSGTITPGYEAIDCAKDVPELKRAFTINQLLIHVALNPTIVPNLEERYF